MTQNKCGCHFCLKTESDLFSLGITTVSSKTKRQRICSVCATKVAIITASEEFLFEESNTLNYGLVTDGVTAKDLYAHLTEYVVGNDSAKKTMSSAIYQHLNRISGIYLDDDVSVDKANVFIAGASGTGKTLIVETLASKAGVPVIVTNANTYTATGYHGRDVTDMLKDLYVKAGNNIDLAQKGIIFIDEIDKIKAKDNSNDVNGMAVQESLLKLIEGGEFIVNVSADIDDPIEITINTSNILFICAGAFDGIHDIVSTRTGGSSIGFGENIEKIKQSNFNYNLIENEDLIKYGMTTEFLGRFPVLIKLNKLSVEDYQDMLTLPKNSLFKQVKKVFSSENIDFSISSAALEHLAIESLKIGLGARGAKRIIWPLINEVLFDLDSKTTPKVELIKDKNGFAIQPCKNELELVV